MKLKLTMILVAESAFAMASSTAFGQKVQVCHKTGNDSFHLISISIHAESAHIKHGDGRPGDPVPNLDGFIFGDNCTPTAAPPPEPAMRCYKQVNLPPNFSGDDIFYIGPIDTLGNIEEAYTSNDGTCTGPRQALLDAGIIAADNATDAQTKCDALTGVGFSPIYDLSVRIFPSAPRYWICSITIST